MTYCMAGVVRVREERNVGGRQAAVAAAALQMTEFKSMRLATQRNKLIECDRMSLRCMWCYMSHTLSIALAFSLPVSTSTRLVLFTPEVPADHLSCYQQCERNLLSLHILMSMSYLYTSYISV